MTDDASPTYPRYPQKTRDPWQTRPKIQRSATLGLNWDRLQAKVITKNCLPGSKTAVTFAPSPLGNKRLTRTEALRYVEEAIGYQFSNPCLLETALTHASVAPTRQESNERQEFLGDAILGMVVCDYVYHRFEDRLEGDLTKLKSVVVSRKVCADLADQLGLSDALFLGKGMTGRHALPLSLRAAVLEAVIAAVFLDGGMEAAKTFVLAQVVPFIEESANSNNHENYKSHLQQYAQRQLSATPHYEQLDEQGPDHAKCFEICVRIEGREFPSAWGPSKKVAEQKAAKNALEAMDVPLDYEDETTSQIPQIATNPDL